MALTEAQLKPFADFIRGELGIIYEAQNYFQLEQRLEKIALMLGANGGATEICDKRSQTGITGMLKSLLLDIATNNETQFFRDPRVYKALGDHVLPELVASLPKGRPLKIWSTAASFGQEPYSLAMLIDEMRATKPLFPQVEILATDISDTALTRARTGKYSQLEVQRGLSAPRMIKYFDKDETESWNAKKILKDSVRFEKFNLLDPVPAHREAHLILSRYVLIYQEQAKKTEIVRRLSRALAPGGIFILGASESGLGMCDELELVNFDGCVFYRKKR